MCVCCRRVCSTVYAPVCADMSVCTSVCVYLYFLTRREALWTKALLIMVKPWSTSAVIYHASQTSSCQPCLLISPFPRLCFHLNWNPKMDPSSSATVYICKIRQDPEPVTAVFCAVLRQKHEYFKSTVCICVMSQLQNRTDENNFKSLMVAFFPILLTSVVQLWYWC